MGLVEMVMPKMGESVMEGTILQWLKKVGDKIEQDESVLEVATDKVDTEVPAPYSGVLKQILAKEGEVVQVGKAIALIETNVGASTNVQVPVSPVNQATNNLIKEKATISSVTHTANGNPAHEEANRFYSPLVMSIAREEKIPLAELETIVGTGKDGRVTKKDILDYVEKRKIGNISTANAPVRTSTSSTPVAPPVTAQMKTTVVENPAISLSGADEIIEMDRMRKMIAERMVESKRISPHVTSFVEADLTKVVHWRNQQKRKMEDGVLTFTPIFIEAIVKAIKDFPMINVSVEGTKIIKKKEINIGMAVALPNGNLIVPVIHQADHLSLRGLALKVNDLARRARDNKLKPDELVGGTYTMSNVGTFGNVMGTPIILQPQVGIMAFGAIRKKPAVIETPEGDVIGIRHMMFLSHSYDHRVVDGALGGMFVRKVADYLEHFDTNRSI
ncbi:MAG: dihydrolipoamide acetyltransferase family protein [Flammeovirgaceae bacterium]